jgi:hypothetical protein
MQKTIAIIGAGQLGSRHLQSLAKLSFKADIYVVDTSENALKIASQRYQEVDQSQNNKLHFISSINELPNKLDLAIIATNSMVRSKIIKLLLEISVVPYLIIEKVLFPTLAEYNEIDTLLKQTNSKAWVNCPRRSFDYYKFLKESISLPLKMEVVGSNWGLGSNSIHFLDVFCYLIGESHLELVEETIENVLLESKRAGYIEFTGSFTFKSNESIISITSENIGSNLPNITLSFGTKTYKIYESGNNPRIEDCSGTNPIIIKEINIPFQSQLTANLVEDIFENGRCDISDYTTSQDIHQQFLSLLLTKLSFIQNDKSINLCPIT